MLTVLFNLTTKDGWVVWEKRPGGWVGLRAFETETMAEVYRTLHDATLVLRVGEVPKDGEGVGVTPQNIDLAQLSRFNAIDNGRILATPEVPKKPNRNS